MKKEEKLFKDCLSYLLFLIYYFCYLEGTTHSIGKNVLLKRKNDCLEVWLSSVQIRAHPLSHKPLNYHRDDYREILQSDVFKNLEDEELERFVDENLEAYEDL